jgi:hypothetical protein
MLLHLGIDRGYPEFYNYLKYIWIITLLTIFSVKNKSYFFVPFILLYTYFLLDDSFTIHELSGIYFRDNYSFQIPILGRQEFGELIPSIIAFSVFIVLFLLLIKYSKSEFKYISLSVFILIGLLVFFGIVVDALNESQYGQIINYFFTLAEDGGELITVSLTCWWFFLLVHCNKSDLSAISNYFNSLLIKFKVFK